LFNASQNPSGGCRDALIKKSETFAKFALVKDWISADAFRETGRIGRPCDVQQTKCAAGKSEL